MCLQCTYRKKILTWGVLGLFLLPPANAAELKPHTVKAFDHYVKLTEARIDSEIAKRNPFLWIDTLPPQRRKIVDQQLRTGQVVIEELKTLDNGKEIDCPDGMIHHWIGTVFVPGTTLQKTMAEAQDYDRHAEVYKPEVARSKLVQRDGNLFKIFYRFKKKKVITVVTNTHHDVYYIPLDPHRLHSKTYTTRIAEVEDPDTPQEKEKPVGNDGGYMWRLDTYWRYLETKEGVYIQCESVTLSRDLPPLIGWMIKGFVKSVPRESLTFTLATTRATLMARLSAAASQPK